MIRKDELASPVTLASGADWGGLQRITLEKRLATLASAFTWTAKLSATLESICPLLSGQLIREADYTRNPMQPIRSPLIYLYISGRGLLGGGLLQ